MPFEVFSFFARTSHPLRKLWLEKSGSLYLSVGLVEPDVICGFDLVALA